MSGTRTALFSRKQSGGMYAIETNDITTGNRWYVDSGSATGADSAGFGQSPDSPCLTIDYAIGLCTANNGDIIYPMPGHAETLSTASDIDVDVAGISIIGLGRGGDKPTISVDTEHTEEAGFEIAAASTLLKNIRFVGINAGGSKNTISVAANDVTIDGCDFIETSTDKELGIGAAYGIITVLDASAAIARLSILNCNCYGLAGNDESFLSVTDGSNGLTNVLIQNCRIIGTFADDVIQADVGTNVNTGWTILDTVLCNAGGNHLCITLDTGAVFYMDNLTLFGDSGTTAPLVGYDASYMGKVWSCEPGAYGNNGLIGSTTNWGA